MSCLADALTVTGGHATYNFSFDDDEEDESELQKDAINIIERYGRIDEWIASYQNIYSTTSLDCFQRLMQNKVMPSRLADFLQYTSRGNADLVRLKAFGCLVDLRMLRLDAVKKYILYSLETEPSPYLRDQLYRIFGRGLGYIAIGQPTADGITQQQLQGGLIVEQEASTDVRAAEIARTQTAPGALAALREELAGNGVLKDAIRSALLWVLANMKFVEREKLMRRTDPKRSASRSLPTCSSYALCSINRSRL